MNTGDVIKGKRPDTGKQWIVGNVVEGKYGQQLELKVTPELRAMIDAAGDGRKLWLGVYAPYAERKAETYEGGQRQPLTQELDDEIPF